MGLGRHHYLRANDAFSSLEWGSFPLRYAQISHCFVTSGQMVRKKAPPSQWKVVLFRKQIQTDVGHCDLFQWLNEILTPLRLMPITLHLSVRDQVGSCFKSAPLVLSVQRDSKCSKTPQKTQFKTPVRAWRMRLFEPCVIY